jgi:F-type H+-transporting ATPase subunit gamma
MKALAASSIGQYEKAIGALAEYYRTVELGLHVCLRDTAERLANVKPEQTVQPGQVGVVVFGSDQGLVGRFNEVVADYATSKLEVVAGSPWIWAVGERVAVQLADADFVPKRVFKVPASVRAIAELVGEVLVDVELCHRMGTLSELYLYYNHPKSGAVYEPIAQRLLPLDEAWLQGVARLPWPTSKRPEVLGANALTLPVLIREYLFVVLYRASAESLASENASRLAAMQRAEKNIDELLEELNATFHRLRQSGIDEELFDLVSGFEALTTKRV